MLSEVEDRTGTAPTMNKPDLAHETLVTLGMASTSGVAGTLVSPLSTVVAKLLFPDQISSAVVEWFIVLT